MSRTNNPVPSRTTHAGAVAKRISPYQELRRSTLACMLWEDSFYESGASIAERISALVPQCKPEAVSMLAIEARTSFKLRHVPLLLCRELARTKGNGPVVSAALAGCIQRADELSEFVSLYWKDGKKPLTRGMKTGLAKAFTQFDEFQLARYNRDNAIKLRDVLFLCHARPLSPEQGETWKKLVNGTLPTPDTWEVAISAAKTPEAKAAEWNRLLRENKLGALALIRNLRNMREAGVPDFALNSALSLMKVERVLPFRFISAARHVPQLEPALEAAMFKCIAGAEKLPGKTKLLIDVSGSMSSPISAKSDLSRTDAANALAILLRELCEEVEIFTFSTTTRAVPPRRGFALRDAIMAQFGGGTQIGAAVHQANSTPHDRLIVLTDEQSSDAVPDPVAANAYMVNVAAYQNGVGYGKWTSITGWSEAIVDYISASEKLGAE